MKPLSKPHSLISWSLSAFSFSSSFKNPLPCPSFSSSPQLCLKGKNKAIWFSDPFFQAASQHNTLWWHSKHNIHTSSSSSTTLHIPARNNWRKNHYSNTVEVAMVCTRVNLLILILSLCSPYKFIQSPMDFGPLNLLPTTTTASSDFGRILFHSPSAVLKPQAPRDISLLLSFLSASPLGKVTVAARGAGHSIHGQAQALDGIVVEMSSLPSEIEFYRRGEGDVSYADVGGGIMWIELLEQSLKLGLAPRSWTDYLYLTIGGTLSNAGISGQTFKHGPQISNVLQLEVVTGERCIMKH